MSFTTQLVAVLDSERQLTSWLTLANPANGLLMLGPGLGKLNHADRQVKLSRRVVSDKPGSLLLKNCVSSMLKLSGVLNSVKISSLSY